MISLFEASKILRRVYLDLVEKSLQEIGENPPYTNKGDLELLEEVEENSGKGNEDGQEKKV